MLTHRHLWAAIDSLADSYGLSPSGLAKRAGLDPTAFNKSKRVSPSGKERWPSTESLAKVLEATDASFDTLASLVRQHSGGTHFAAQTIPVIGFAQAGSEGFFDDGGFPVGAGWDDVHFPEIKDGNAYALEISGDSMLPLYRDGDIIIVSPNANVRKGDRVVVKTKSGEVMAKILSRKTASRIALTSLNPDYEERNFSLKDISWMARIIWASQ